MKTTLRIAAAVSLNWLISRKSQTELNDEDCPGIVVDWKFDRRFGSVGAIVDGYISSIRRTIVEKRGHLLDSDLVLFFGIDSV